MEPDMRDATDQHDPDPESQAGELIEVPVEEQPEEDTPDADSDARTGPATR